MGRTWFRNSGGPPGPFQPCTARPTLSPLLGAQGGVTSLGRASRTALLISLQPLSSRHVRLAPSHAACQFYLAHWLCSFLRYRLSSALSLSSHVSSLLGQSDLQCKSCHTVHAGPVPPPCSSGLRYGVVRALAAARLSVDVACTSRLTPAQAGSRPGMDLALAGERAWSPPSAWAP